MSFLAPTAFAFAAAIPVVIVFYLLKRKRVVKLVSSSLLWQKFLAETQASAPFQKLRHNWLLILQILMLALIVFALTRPYFSGDQKQGALYVAILDASASMQATDVEPSRFESARDEARDLVSSMKDNDQMVVLRAASNTRVMQSSTGEKGALRRAIDACEPSDSPTRLVEALKLAQTLIENRMFAEVHLFSDGAIDEIEGMHIKDIPVVYHKVGERSDNLGVVQLDVKAHPDDPAQKAVFASVGNYSEQTQRTQLELRFNNQMLASRSLNVPGGTNAQEVFLVPQSEDGVFTVTLSNEDDLKVDNQASAVSLMPHPVKVLLVTPGNRFLEKSLRSIPNIDLEVVPALVGDAADQDVVVLDGVIPAEWPKPNVLAINVARPGWFAAVGEVEYPSVVDAKATHALLRFVDFDTVDIARSKAVKTPSWALPIVESQQTPLILAGEFERQSVIWIGFDTLESTWPLRVAYPIFMQNAVEWLNPALANAAELSVRSGEPFRLPLLESLGAASVELPDGSTEELVLDEGATEVLFGGTTRQGVYRITAGTNSTPFCVNLLDSVESNILPQEELEFGKYGSVAATGSKRANVEIWRWIAMAGLCVLLFEWWFYHRRTA